MLEKLNRLILDALPDAGRPLTTKEVIASIVARLGYGNEAAKAMSHRVRANLLYISKTRGEVEKEGQRAVAQWRLLAWITASIVLHEGAWSDLRLQLWGRAAFIS